MATKYDVERADAKADIDEAGAVGYILRDGKTKYPISILMLTYEEREIDGSLIRWTDQKFMIPALGLAIVPDPEKDRVVIDDKRPEFAASVGNYRIVTSKPFQPGGAVIYYDLQARDG